MNGNVNGIINQTTWNKAFSGSGNQFFIAQNFESIDSSLSGDTYISNEYKNVEITLTAKGNPNASMENSWIHMDGFLVIDRSGLHLMK